MMTPLITKLEQHINNHRTVEFTWGTDDCFIFVCRWIKTITGRDPMEDLGEKGKYHTKTGAYKILKKLGGELHIVTKILGEGIHPSKAVKGSVVCGDWGQGLTLGICIGMDSVFLGLSGIETKRTVECQTAWSL
jgi:hypothetical protein